MAIGISVTNANCFHIWLPAVSTGSPPPSLWGLFLPPPPDFRTGREGAERSFSEIRGAPAASATWQMKDAPGTRETGEEAPNKNPRAWVLPPPSWPDRPARTCFSRAAVPPSLLAGRPAWGSLARLGRARAAGQHRLKARQFFVLARTHVLDETHRMVHSIGGSRSTLSNIFSRLLVEGMCDHSFRMLSAYSFAIGLLFVIAVIRQLSLFLFQDCSTTMPR